VCLSKEITGTTVTNPNSVLSLSLGENVGFKDNANNYFFYDSQQYITNGQAPDQLMGNKNGKSLQ
jgi:hypothetical protein